MNRCNLCKGFKSLAVKQVGQKVQWFDCPACEARGTVGQINPETISIGKSQQKYCKPLKEE
jgi:hypothetical protein